MEKYEDRLTKVENRLSSLEEEMVNILLLTKKFESDQGYILKALDEIKRSQKELEKYMVGIVTWGTRTVIGALILAVLNFIIKGGLIK